MLFVFACSNKQSFATIFFFQLSPSVLPPPMASLFGCFCWRLVLLLVGFLSIAFFIFLLFFWRKKTLNQFCYSDSHAFVRVKYARDGILWKLPPHSFILLAILSLLVSLLFSLTILLNKMND